MARNDIYDIPDCPASDDEGHTKPSVEPRRGKTRKSQNYWREASNDVRGSQKRRQDPPPVAEKHTVGRVLTQASTTSTPKSKALGPISVDSSDHEEEDNELSDVEEPAPKKRSQEQEFSAQDDAQFKRMKTTLPGLPTISRRPHGDIGSSRQNIALSLVPCIPCMQQWAVDKTWVCQKPSGNVMACSNCPDPGSCTTPVDQLEFIRPLCIDLHNMAKDAFDGILVDESEWTSKLTQIYMYLGPEVMKTTVRKVRDLEQRVETYVTLQTCSDAKVLVLDTQLASLRTSTDTQISELKQDVLRLQARIVAIDARKPKVSPASIPKHPEGKPAEQAAAKVTKKAQGSLPFTPLPNGPQEITDEAKGEPKDDPAHKNPQDG